METGLNVVQISSMHSTEYECMHCSSLKHNQYSHSHLYSRNAFFPASVRFKYDALLRIHIELVYNQYQRLPLQQQTEQLALSLLSATLCRVLKNCTALS